MPARAYQSRSQAREDSSSEEETPLITPRPVSSRNVTKTKPKASSPERKASSSKKKVVADDSSSDEEVVIRVSQNKKGTSIKKKTGKDISSSDEKEVVKPATTKKGTSTKKVVVSSKKPTSIKKTTRKQVSSSDEEEAPVITPARKVVVRKPVLRKEVSSSDEEETPAAVPARTPLVKKAATANTKSTQAASHQASTKKTTTSTKKPIGQREERKAELGNMPNDLMKHMTRFLSGSEQLKLLQTNKEVEKLAARLETDFSEKKMSLGELHSLKRRYPAIKIVGLHLGLSKGDDLKEGDACFADVERLIISTDGPLPEEVSILELCPKLSELKINGQLADVTGIGKGGELRKLELQLQVVRTETFDLAILNGLDALEELYLEKSELKTAKKKRWTGELELNGKLSLPRLRKLTLKKTDAMAGFVIEKCPKLIEMELLLSYTEDLSFLSPELPLRKLKLETSKVYDDFMDVLAAYKDLTSLSLVEEHHVHSTSKLSFLKELPNLESISLAYREAIIFVKEDAELFTNCSKLKSLTVSGFEGDLADLSSCQRLESLELVGGFQIYRFGHKPSGLSFLPGKGSSLKKLHMTNLHLERDIFAQITNLTQLEDFYLAGNFLHGLLPGSDLNVVGELTRLKHLVLRIRSPGPEEPDPISEAALGKLKALRTLEISSFPGEDLTCLAGSKSLSNLILSSDKLVSLAGLEALTSLQRLEISNAPRLSEIEALPTCPTLRVLSFLRCDVLETFTLPTGEAKYELEVLKIDRCPLLWKFSLDAELPALKTLELGECLCTTLEGLSHCPNLTKFSIEASQIRDIDFLPALAKLAKLTVKTTPAMRVFALPAELPGLKELELHYPEDILSKTVLIEGFDKCPNLEIFALKNSSVTEVDTLTNCPKLRKVLLRKNKSLKSIAGLSKCINLKELAIYWSEKLKDLTPLRACTQLTSLSLTETKVTKESLVRDLPSLDLAKVDI